MRARPACLRVCGASHVDIHNRTRRIRQNLLLAILLQLKGKSPAKQHARCFYCATEIQKRAAGLDGFTPSHRAMINERSVSLYAEPEKASC